MIQCKGETKYYKPTLLCMRGEVWGWGHYLVMILNLLYSDLVPILKVAQVLTVLLCQPYLKVAELLYVGNVKVVCSGCLTLTFIGLI